jgi:hypothetical protein
VLAGIGTLILAGEEVTFGDGMPGPNTRRLREALSAVQRGEATDVHGWTRAVVPCPAPSATPDGRAGSAAPRQRQPSG